MEKTARGQNGTSQGHETPGATGVISNRCENAYLIR